MLTTSRLPIAVKDRSLIQPSITSKAIWLKLNESAGNPTDSMGLITLPTLTANGTTTNIWDNAGWFTSAGDNYIDISDGSMDQILRLDNIDSGGVMIAYDYLKSGSPSGSLATFGYGRQGTTNTIGGYYIFDQANDRQKIILYQQDGTKQDAVQGEVPADGVRHSVVFFLDITTMMIHCYIDGSLEGSGAIPTTGGLPGVSTGYGTAIWAKSSGGAPSANMMTGHQMKRLYIGRYTGVLSSNLGAVAQDFYEYENEFGWSMEDA